MQFDTFLCMAVFSFFFYTILLFRQLHTASYFIFLCDPVHTLQFDQQRFGSFDVEGGATPVDTRCLGLSGTCCNACTVGKSLAAKGWSLTLILATGCCLRCESSGAHRRFGQTGQCD